MKLLPLFIFWCLWFLNHATRAAFSPVLPLIKDNLTLSHGEAGGFFTSLSLGFALSMLLSGRFASYMGYRRTIVAGYIGIGVVMLWIQWTKSYYLFHFLFFLLGISTGTYIPSIIPIITETYETKHWGKVIGIHDSASSFSIFTIPILMAFGLQFLSWKKILLIFGIICFVLPIFFLRVSIEPKKGDSKFKISYRDIIKKRFVYIMGILSIMASASSIGLYLILPLYLIKERGIEFSYANTLFGISRIGGFFISIISGFLSDRFGYRFMIFLSLSLAGFSTFLLSYISNLSSIIIIMILQATFPIAYFPAAFAAISKLTSTAERSTITGLIFSIGVIFGMGLTPLILGLVADHFGFQKGIMWLGIVVTFSSILGRLLEAK